VDVEWLILADAAQVVGSKLYLMGGGWDLLTVNVPFPARQRCALAASFRVPWNETNMRRSVEILIATEDQQEVAKIQIQVEVGRPAGIIPGVDQRSQFAMDLNLELQAPGTFVIIANVEGEEQARTYFRVQAGPGSRPAAPPAG
jgi:hypothetical protein